MLENKEEGRGDYCKVAMLVTRKLSWTSWRNGSAKNISTRTDSASFSKLMV